MKFRLLIAALALACSTAAVPQNTSACDEDTWYVGVTGGVHASKLRYTDLDKTYFPDNKYTTSGVGGIFLRKSFGQERNFMLRPELLWLNRGGKLSNIYNTNGYYNASGISDIYYKLNAHYIDLRVPLMWQMGNTAWSVRPYLYVAPIVSMCTGGKIDYRKSFDQTDYDKGLNYEGAVIDATKSNISQWYFAGAVGAGLNWYLNVGAHRCYIGLDAMYEHGFSDTYGNENDALHKILLNPDGSTVEGHRRMRGFELRASIGVPLSVFSRTKELAYIEVPDDIVPPVDFETADTGIEVEEVVLSKPCYSLDEINDMIINGQSVEGKTICAIDDMITFEFGKSDILPSSYTFLDNLSETLKRINGNVLIKGHTDNIGEEDYNMRLSRDRAMSVYNYLIGKGVSTQKLSYAWYGMSQPIADNDTEEGRRLNRRVEFEIR